MADDVKLVRVRLRNTGRYVNVDEETAKALENEDAAATEAEGASTKKLEETMTELEGKNQELAVVSGEVEELKGELSVYKEKLDELLEGGIEAAAEGMIEEQGEAGEILANMSPMDAEGKEMGEEEKKGFQNSIKRLHGTALHSAVLTATGMKVENMSPEAIRGAFRAQLSMVRSGKFQNKTVAGAKFLNHGDKGAGAAQPVARTAMERLGFKG